ncbi:BQ5605_C038g11713 [Microbotryum silenes-dioicae]|uniref:BQ5605_C038g11713 protein n=1 Tax=Microbotryum silenes-dioicae TaxID=796604 RepID=A0A2X0MIZ2_9BASI|nr:BQ5605_C038g11713 [Microbotryum silenes-dioicae]
MSDSEFKRCLAKNCAIDDTGLNACSRLDQATLCVRQGCPSGHHLDYLNVT